MPPLPKRRPIHQADHVSTKNKKESLPWIEKYRPSNLNEVISHDSKIEVLNKLIEKRDIPHLLLYGLPGTGKCLGKGTEIRMFDGTLKKVEDVKQDELLLGDDLTSRTVLSICSGTEQLYRVKQSNGIDYVVNESHILTLKKTRDNHIKWDKQQMCYQIFYYHQDGQSINERFYVKSDQEPSFDSKLAAFRVAVQRLYEIGQSPKYLRKGDSIDLSLIDYLNQSELWKTDFQGYRILAEHNEQEISLDPYVLGVWLSIGSSHQPYIITKDLDLLTRLREHTQLELIGEDTYSLSPDCDRLLQELNLYHHKRIPDQYKHHIIETRTRLLAGILEGSRANHYSERLTNDLIELYLSTGYNNENAADYLDPVLSWSGNYITSDLEIERLEIGEYYGFELNGNGRFLLKDYTVTHNTSMILALAKTMYGPNYKRYILELNASDDRGIDIVRNRIPMFAKTKSDDMRFVILDEADAMTADAQSALRRIMELYIKTCRFCLICNNINKIIPGIQSRCAKMRFGVLAKDSIRLKLEQIIKEEGIEAEPDALNQLLEVHQDFRQILNTLQCLKSIRSGEVIREIDVSNYLGKATPELMNDLINTFEHEPFKKCYQTLMELHRENRVNIIDLVKNLVNYVIDQEDMSEIKRGQLLNGLAKVEYRMITGSDTEIQLASLVGIWLECRDQS